MDSDQRKGTIVFVPIMTQELDPDISCPDLGILNEKSLYFSRITSFVCSEILPLLHLDWISITDAHTEGSEHAREELVVGKNKSIDPDIFL